MRLVKIAHTTASAHFRYLNTIMAAIDNGCDVDRVRAIGCRAR